MFIGPPMNSGEQARPLELPSPRRPNSLSADAAPATPAPGNNNK